MFHTTTVIVQSIISNMITVKKISQKEIRIRDDSITPELAIQINICFTFYKNVRSTPSTIFSNMLYTQWIFWAEIEIHRKNHGTLSVKDCHSTLHCLLDFICSMGPDITGWYICFRYTEDATCDLLAAYRSTMVKRCNR